jgi:hypothetical protein
LIIVALRYTLNLLKYYQYLKDSLMKLMSRFKRVQLITPFLILSTITFSLVSLVSLEGRADEGKIGEIRYSILTEPQFQELYGPEWELMIGQALGQENSHLLQLWGKGHLPDARGVYLRSANHGRPTTEGNPHGDADACGAYLKDELASHTHEDKGHDHSWSFTLATTHGEGGGGASRGGGHGEKPQGIQGGIAPGHANIQATGGAETRPRSVIVNTFIKVRDPAQTTATHAPIVTPQMMNQITTGPEFKTAVESAIRETLNRRNR